MQYRYASVTAHSSIAVRKKLLFPLLYFQHTPKTRTFHRLRFSVCFRRLLKMPTPSNFSLPSIPLSFQPLVTIRAFVHGFYKYAIQSSTIFVRVVSPILPSHSHVPPAHSRHSPPGCKAPFHSCRLCASVTARSSMPANQD